MADPPISTILNSPQAHLHRVLADYSATIHTGSVLPNP